jgi:hypothetical protein
MINRESLNWPKPVITEDQLRAYADAPKDTHDLWQDNLLGGATLITGVANIYDGAVFYAVPKTKE